MTTGAVGAVVDVGVRVESAEGVGGTLGGVKVGSGAEGVVGSRVELMGGLVETGGGNALITCSRQPVLIASVAMRTSVER